MTHPERIAAARDQLNRVLTFFPRVDGKGSVLLAINTSMVALLATRALPYTHLRWELIPVTATLLLIALSVWHLYQEAFPALDGGEDSLVYFRPIAGRTETNFRDAWLKQADEQHLSDLLGQIWRNSVILKKKFDHIRWAFIFLACALLPWAISLIWLTVSTGTVAQPQ